MKLSVGALINHPTKGEGAVYGETENAWKIYFQDHGEELIGKNYEGFELLEPGLSNEGFTKDDLIEAVQAVFDKQQESMQLVDLGAKWDGGVMRLIPGEEGLQSKDVPIETFFHKIVMLRDRLRVLEQNINSHKGLSDEEKVNLQQYITRCYGSLTTFNVLFSKKDDYFVGQAK
ncbi:MAG: hypothetical protein O2984_04305 [Bacteroidetes bacterium]|nr:hypothetical protein [Bacteroidota bacterium]